MERDSGPDDLQYEEATGHYLQHRGGPGAKLTDEEMELERLHLFRQRVFPIASIPDEENLLHSEIQRQVEEKQITVPVIHVRNQTYMIGCALYNCERRDDEACVQTGEGYERFDAFVLENREHFENTLIQHMHQHDQSLEWVCEQIITDKQRKAETSVQ